LDIDAEIISFSKDQHKVLGDIKPSIENNMSGMIGRIIFQPKVQI
jgi:hypothetical protein